MWEISLDGKCFFHKISHIYSLQDESVTIQNLFEEGTLCNNAILTHLKYGSNRLEHNIY